MLRVAVISDIFKNSGLGNYCRSRELFFFLKKKKLKTDFFLYKKFLSNKNFYNVIIIDLPLKSYNLEIISKYPDSLVLSLDHNQKYKVDANIAIFKKSPYATKNFVNLKYSIIRRELQNYKSSFNKDLLFISIGSSDIKNKRIYLKKNIHNILKEFFYRKLFLEKFLETIRAKKILFLI